ncbi:MAG: HD domain-containing protein, partial [Anaerolineae bacterium]|nr:HD domain-containing protein [Anaerolineae bacterium]
DITERKRAEENVINQVKKLKALRKIDLQIINRRPLNDTIQIVLNEISSTLKADAINILLLNENNQDLYTVAQYGLDADVKHCNNVISKQCFPWKVIHEKRPIQARLNDPNNPPVCDGFSSKGFLTFYGTPLIVDDRVLGMIEVYSRKEEERINQDWIDYLETLAGQVAIAIDSTHLINELRESNLELNEAYEATIEGWSKALELRDEETQGHSERVMHLACDLANEMGFAEEDKIHFRRGVLLHDIGKMGIADNILLKPGPLTPEEWEIMRQHPVMAYELLKEIPYLRPALDIPYSHHERWNGSGYPRGLAGEDIPLAARIFAVVDVWDALISDRPYRPGWKAEDIKKYILENSGVLFDPNVVAFFFKLPAICQQLEAEPDHQ